MKFNAKDYQQPLRRESDGALMRRDPYAMAHALFERCHIIHCVDERAVRHSFTMLAQVFSDRIEQRAAGDNVGVVDIATSDVDSILNFLTEIYGDKVVREVARQYAGEAAE